jgi:protein MpaA
MRPQHQLRALISLLICLIAISARASGQHRDTSNKSANALAAESQEKAQATPTAVKPSPPRYMEVGKSSRGRPINATIFGTGKRMVIVLGGIHGNEQSGVVLANALIATLWRESIPSDLTLIIVPQVNPDGVIESTRVNGRGVDINRNFPSKSWRSDYPDLSHYPGTAPASEPETQAVIKLLERYPPDLLITFHAALGCMNWDGPGETYARVMAFLNTYPLCRYLGYETPGSLGTYAGIDRSVPTVTIELRGVDSGQLVKENLPAVRAAIGFFSTTKQSPKTISTK